jgi:heme oxygenase (biliverdin-producing, ferredoxin)
MIAAMPAALPQPPTLPERLKAATAAAHARAERSLLMRRLLRGELPRPAYTRLLAALHGLYTVLDTTLPAQRSPLWHPALARAPALAQDLRQLCGPAWPAGVDPGVQARAYAERLRALAGPARHRLAAHAYVRYLGDLYGGQSLARAVQRAYRLGPGDGVAFYDFGSPEQVAGLRSHLRAGLAALPLAAAEEDELVAEACWAFDAHDRMFAELA